MSSVVITGASVCTHLGFEREYNQALSSNNLKLSPLTDEIIQDLQPEEKPYLDMQSILAYVAFERVLEDSELDLDWEKIPLEKKGLALGTAYGPLDTMHLFFKDFAQKGPKRVRPFLFPHAYFNTAVSLLSIDYQCGGEQSNPCSGQCSSSHAMSFAHRSVKEERSTIMIAGGVDALPILLEKESVPRRASSLVLFEEEEHCRSRKAKVLAQFLSEAEIRSEGEGSGVKKSFELALMKSGLQDQQIDQIWMNMEAYKALEGELKGKNLICPEQRIGSLGGAVGSVLLSYALESDASNIAIVVLDRGGMAITQIFRIGDR